MSYSFEEMNDEQLAILDDLEMLRDDLISELDAVNQYEDHILEIENEDAVNTLKHIIDEEKEHVAELLRLIQNLDRAQAEKLKGIL